jgi:hypothetical protein
MALRLVPDRWPRGACVLLRDLLVAAMARPNEILRTVVGVLDAAGSPSPVFPDARTITR